MTPGFFANRVGTWVTVHLEDSACRRGKDTGPVGVDRWLDAEGWGLWDGHPRYITRCRRCVVRWVNLIKAGVTEEEIVGAS